VTTAEDASTIDANSSGSHAQRRLLPAGAAGAPHIFRIIIVALSHPGRRWPGHPARSYTLIMAWGCVRATPGKIMLHHQQHRQKWTPAFSKSDAKTNS
jgi:hypothetical protein